MKYEEAVKQLEEIVSKLETDELDIDQIATNLKQAQKLIKMCKDKLTATENEVNTILGEE